VVSGVSSRGRSSAVTAWRLSWAVSSTCCGNRVSSEAPAPFGGRRFALVRRANEGAPHPVQGSRRHTPTCAPDVIALQEVTARSAPVFRAQLVQLGLHHVLDSFALIPTLSG
jgi:hypothetical protein